MTGLTSGTTYRFTVQAINANGAGPASAQSNAVTPTVAVAPTAPTGVGARPAGESAQVTWTAPSGTGGSPITGQTVTPYIGAAAQTPGAGRRVGDERRGDRPDERVRVHVQGGGDQRRRDGPAVGGVGGDHAARDALRLPRRR